MKKCPKCGAEAFEVTAHVTQTWRVDGTGYFLECLSDCEEVTHEPEDEDIWTCANCGFEAAGREFNVPKSETKEKLLKLHSPRLLTEKEYEKYKSLIPCSYIPWWLDAEKAAKYALVDARGNLVSCQNGNRYNCIRPVIECEDLSELGLKPKDMIKIGKTDYYVVLNSSLILADKLISVAPFNSGCEENVSYASSSIKPKVIEWFERVILQNEREAGSKAVPFEL